MKTSGLADSPLFFISRNENDLIKKNIEKKKRITPIDHATLKPRNHDTMIANIHKAIQEIGKEASTYRFTSNEKKSLAEIIYKFRNMNIRITENEIVRIASNYLIYEHKLNRKKSVLTKIIFF